MLSESGSPMTQDQLEMHVLYSRRNLRNFNQQKNSSGAHDHRRWGMVVPVIV